MRFLLLFFFCWVHVSILAQVDTTYIYNGSAPYGTLDLRIAKSPTRYYYLQEGITFSYRESSTGVRTNTFRDMTSWDSSPYEQGNLREKDGENDYFVMNYRLLKPIAYNAAYSKGYPLILMMHGSGEHGNCWNSNCYHANSSYSPVENSPAAPTDADHKLLNNDHNLLHGGKAYLDAVTLAGSKLPGDPSLPEGAFPGFVLFPQNLNGWSNASVQDAIRIVRLLVKKYNIDEDRIYINGLSNGAHGLFEAVKRAPWMFSAVIAMSAIDDGFITNVNMESTVSHIPMWFIQGELDQQPSPGKTKSYIRKFRDAGTVVRYTEYEGVGHTVWNKAYKEPDFFSWMLGQSNADLHAFAGSASLCVGEGAQGLKLSMPPGFFGYQWQRNGQTISGATASDLVVTSVGKYRGRFARVANPSAENWNEWSPEINVTEAEQPTAEIRQSGTVVLRDLNGLNQAMLESANEAAHYYWYKDGSLLNLPGDQDDTLRAITVNSGSCNGACSGNGAYTLVVSDYNQCRSDFSDPKHLFFNDQAPLSLTAPSALQATAASASTATVRWKDNSSGEIAFEIWKRRNEGSQWGPWILAGLAEAGKTAFNDAGLVPSSQYEYKIRAIGSQGRSDYFPSGDTGSALTTPKDTKVPAAPDNVDITRLGIQKIRIDWSPVKDDSGIRSYQIAYDGNTLTTSDTTIVVDQLGLNKRYDFTVRAVDLGNNISEPGEVFIHTSFNGLYYEHLPGHWRMLDSVEWQLAEYRGFVLKFGLEKKTQDDYFGFRFDGFLYIKTPGVYRFRLISDDGSRMRLNGNRIINNDGRHELKTVESGNLTLQEGPQRIMVEYFDYADEDSLMVQYKGPDTGNQWEEISAEALRSTLVVSNEPNAGVSLLVDVYPNPVKSDHFMVSVIDDRPGQVIIDILDSQGMRVFNSSQLISASGAAVQINTSALKSGMYIVNVITARGNIQRKVIITK